MIQQFHFWYSPEENKSANSTTCMDTNVHCGIISTSQHVNATCMFIHRCMNKDVVGIPTQWTIIQP